MAKVEAESIKDNTGKVLPVGKLNAEEQFIFTKDNWKFVIIGLVLIALGFALMAGGKSADPNVFNEKEVYSFRRITLAPILVVCGFLVQLYAILKDFLAKK